MNINKFSLCPCCNKSCVFTGITKLKDKCNYCGINYDNLTIGDGASWITTSLICFIFVPIIFFLEIKFSIKIIYYLIFIFPSLSLLSILILRISRYILLKRSLEIK